MPTDAAPIVGRAAILGVGLMGGSLGLAWKRKGVVGEVVGVGRDAAHLALACDRGAIDRFTTDAAAAVAGADLVVLAAPIDRICAWAVELAPLLSPGAVVTDVGSTKERVVRTWEAHLPPGAAFIGGHPMCGSEQGGIAAARADLYEGAPYILTPGERAGPAAVELVAGLARAAGGLVRTMPPDLHDRRVAYISHLPQLVAVATAAAAQEGEDYLAGVLELAAGGFRDTTRIALSPPQIWQEIFDSNREPILAALAHFRVWLQRLEVAVAAGDAAAVARAFEQAARARRGVGRQGEG